jgi:hypothetical protein
MMTLYINKDLDIYPGDAVVVIVWWLELQLMYAISAYHH